MSAKAIYESDGKVILSKHLSSVSTIGTVVSIHPETNLDVLPFEQTWLTSTKLVVKVDQLIKRRGKLGLLAADVNWETAKSWIRERMHQRLTVGNTTGVLKHFIVEPFVEHQPEDEFYLCVYSSRNNDTVLFHHEGGIDVGDVESKAKHIDVMVDEPLTKNLLESSSLFSKLRPAIRPVLVAFVETLYRVYVDLHFTYLEINPLVVRGDRVYVLDLAAKLDQTAEYLCRGAAWGVGPVCFPPPFGREAYPEEAYIAEMDSKTGASLKLTLLNPRGKIWTMVAGGGASVIYSDTICDLGGAGELANYGEYSGAPSESQTYEYAKTILKLMTREKRDDGKVLIIGGGIANFTNVAATFKGIVRALKEFESQLREHRASVFVRRGGPNFQEGLRVMRELGATLGVPMHVFGTETHMTAVVAMALGSREIPMLPPPAQPVTANFLLSSPGASGLSKSRANSAVEPSRKAIQTEVFNAGTKAFIWGMQPKAVQGMLDFDYVCSRKSASVAGMIYPFTGDHKQKFYWGHKEILIPVYKEMAAAMSQHPLVDTIVSFASLRSAYESTVEAMSYPQIQSIAIIAEGIPENLTRRLIKLANSKGVSLIGPATVGGIKPGCFKIGNTGGMLDNILASKLYRPGSVAYVSRSGGMSNELNNIIARTTNGVYEGVAIGGDRYPGSTFLDHILRYEADPAVKLIVFLGEVGGVEEYSIVEAVRTGRVGKPVVGWCIGTCATMFGSDVQFGHAGASVGGAAETATAKNEALRSVGVIVPSSFDALGEAVQSVYNGLVARGVVVPQEEAPPPTVPMDYSWARELGIIRKPASFMTTICDERGEELVYAGMPITQVIKEDLGIGGVLSLLWFQRRLPGYACKFMEICLMVTADHGPAVSGAHNTIVCARAAKDLVSSLTSGLLTIGERFGGALDAAAKQFSQAYDAGTSPNEFVNQMRKDRKLIMGIGHRVKSLNNPDKRTEILKEFAKSQFPSTPLIDYALEVEKITTSKKSNLILNVDGLIGVAFVDLLRTSGCFTAEESNEYINIGALNGIFVLGRSLGFIGHYLDQKRLKQGLYRHPWDDISYVLPENINETE